MAGDHDHAHGLVVFGCKTKQRQSALLREHEVGKRDVESLLREMCLGLVEARRGNDLMALQFEDVLKGCSDGLFVVDDQYRWHGVARLDLVGRD